MDKMSRNAKGLVDALFQTIDDLNERKITPEHARAVSHTAKTIVAVASLELEIKKLEGAAETVPQLISLEVSGPKEE